MKIRSYHKNKIGAVSVLVILSTLFSCKKLIEIPGNPPTFITREQQFADSATTMSAVAGVYAYNQGKGFGYSDANFTIATGLSADEIAVPASNTDKTQFYNYSLTPLSTGIIALWQYPYQAMYRVNDVLDGVTNNSNLSDSFVAQITGEMKVVRALYYFNLVHIFGGVPLITTIDYNQTARLPRATVDAIYKQIMADLTDAVSLLPANYPSAGRARPNLYTAKALLAKVHLYQGQWQEAYNEADDIIESHVYSIEDVPVSGVFLNGSKEAIWQLPAKTSYQQTAEAQNFVTSNGATPRYLVTSFLLDQFEADDQRRQNWIGTSIVNNENLYYPFKYKNKQAANVPLEDYMILRLGEVLLIRAEAAAHLNNLEQALTDVNTLRTRAGLPGSTADATAQNAVLNAVMHERQVELCFEWGNRWFDLKRNVTPETSAATVLGAEKTGYHAHAALYPIPQGQRQLNHALTQNPGYN